MNKLLILSAAALALVPAAAMAQDATTAPAMTPMAPASAMAPMPANPFEVTPSPDSERLDYSLLYNNTFNKVDIDQAKSQHLSDRQIAKIYKLAKLSGCEFREVYCKIKDGYTFPTLAGWYGVSLTDLDNCSAEESDINAYETAYAATAIGGAPRLGRVMSSIDSIKH